MSDATKMDRVRTILGVMVIFVALVSGILLIQREVTGKIVEIRNVSDVATTNVEINSNENKNGGRIELRYYENKSSDKLLIFFHGAAGPDNKKPKEASNFVNVLAPTYVTNTIVPIPLEDQQLYDIVDQSIENALERGFSYGDISIIGFSMGGAQAIYAAVHYSKLNIVIPIGTFTSFREACVELVGGGVSTCTIIPEDYLLTEEIAGEARAPIHQYHSVDDKVVNIADGRKLFKLIGSEQKEFTEIRGEHSDYDIVQIISENL